MQFGEAFGVSLPQNNRRFFELHCFSKFYFDFLLPCCSIASHHIAWLCCEADLDTAMKRDGASRQSGFNNSRVLVELQVKSSYCVMRALFKLKVNKFN